MFFIFGSPRSGTTLLALSLNAHPDIVIPHETDFIIPAAFVFDRLADVNTRREILKPLITRASAFSSLSEYLTAAEICAIIDAGATTLSGLLADIYAALARKAGARLAGDKSPNDLGFLRILIKNHGIVPGVKIIHIVRDVRDVVSSLMERGWVPQIESYFPRAWSGSNLYLHSLFCNDDNYHLVRFEDLAGNPAKILTGVCRHLGVEFLPQMLDPQGRHPRYKGLPQHQHLYEPISTATVGYFRDKINPALVALCEAQSREAMAVFGYATEQVDAEPAANSSPHAYSAST